MILTQTLMELGCPNWTAIGMYQDSEEPTSHGGYGYEFNHGRKLALEIFEARLIERHGPDAKLINAKFTTRAGDAHPSYYRTRYIITGDLYVGS